MIDLFLNEVPQVHVGVGFNNGALFSALIATDDPAGLAQKIVALGLSVRQAEALARNKAEASDNQTAEPKGQIDLRAIEKAISETLGLRVSLQPGAGEKGKLVINFKTLEQFEELCAKLGAKL